MAPSARGIARMLRMIGARAIYATHLHGLGNAASLNDDTTGDSLVASLAAGSEAVDSQQGGEPSVRRTCKIQPSPQGISFARDIARKYGIEQHQLTAALKEWKEL